MPFVSSCFVALVLILLPSPSLPHPHVVRGAGHDGPDGEGVAAGARHQLTGGEAVEEGEVLEV